VTSDPRNQILVGDVRERIADIPAGSIDCAITSPPYFQLRNYGLAEQIGVEASVDEWVTNLRVVLNDVGRTLKDTGSLWLNLGDTYSSHPSLGAARKSLLLGPERLGLVLLEDGWLIRNKIVWAKTNPLPANVRDRLACKWEVIYLLTRKPTYYFDLDAIRLPHTGRRSGRPRSGTDTYPPRAHRAPIRASASGGGNTGLAGLRARGLSGHALGKNPGDVWTLATAAFRGAHFATFPKHLVVRPLRASCPERVCTSCGQAWRRSHERTLGHFGVSGELRRHCGCDAGWRPGIVLDPFLGSGTVALAAIEHGRDWIGIELNPDFAAMAQGRIDEALHAREQEAEGQQAA
jgi:site-specific DNA-methyltransferase (adenine-specific)